MEDLAAQTSDFKVCIDTLKLMVDHVVQEEDERKENGIMETADGNVNGEEEDEEMFPCSAPECRTEKARMRDEIALVKSALGRLTERQILFEDFLIVDKGTKFKVFCHTREKLLNMGKCRGDNALSKASLIPGSSHLINVLRRVSKGQRNMESIPSDNAIVQIEQDEAQRVGVGGNPIKPEVESTGGDTGTEGNGTKEVVISGSNSNTSANETNGNNDKDKWICHLCGTKAKILNMRFHMHVHAGLCYQCPTCKMPSIHESKVRQCLKKNHLVPPETVERMKFPLLKSVGDEMVRVTPSDATRAVDILYAECINKNESGEVHSITEFPEAGKRLDESWNKDEAFSAKNIVKEKPKPLFPAHAAPKPKQKPKRPKPLLSPPKPLIPPNSMNEVSRGRKAPRYSEPPKLQESAYEYSTSYPFSNPYTSQQIGKSTTAENFDQFHVNYNQRTAPTTATSRTSQPPWSSTSNFDMDYYDDDDNYDMTFNQRQQHNAAAAAAASSISRAPQGPTQNRLQSNYDSGRSAISLLASAAESSTPLMSMSVLPAKYNYDSYYNPQQQRQAGGGSAPSLLKPRTPTTSSTPNPFQFQSSSNSSSTGPRPLFPSATAMYPPPPPPPVDYESTPVLRTSVYSENDTDDSLMGGYGYGYSTGDFQQHSNESIGSNNNANGGGGGGPSLTSGAAKRRAKKERDRMLALAMNYLQ